MTLIDIRGLTKRFGGLIANNQVDLSIDDGEIHGVIGPNGAGKTTLANLMTGLYPPNSGTIRLAGDDIAGLSPHQIARKGLLRTFQVCRIFGSLTVLDNLLLPYLAQRRSRGEPAAGERVGPERARELLDLTRLAPLAGEPARALSGGQRALLQVACGFMVPGLRCYVLDEPFAGINPIIKDDIVALIIEQNRRRGITFFVISHEMEVMRRLCHRVTVMIEGRVFLQGTLAEVAANKDVIGAYLGKAWA